MPEMSPFATEDQIQGNMLTGQQPIADWSTGSNKIKSLVEQVTDNKDV